MRRDRQEVRTEAAGRAVSWLLTNTHTVMVTATHHSQPQQRKSAAGNTERDNFCVVMADLGNVQLPKLRS